MVAPLEVLAFAIGIKPALRFAGEPPEAERWRARGAAVAEGHGIVYVARSEQDARALRDAEALVHPGARRRAPDAEILEAHRALGRGLGYPRCCVEGFVARVVRGVDERADGTRAAERVVAAEDALRRTRVTHARLSFLLPTREALVPFDPCAFDCAPSLRYAAALFAAYEAREPESAASLRARLLAPLSLDASGARSVEPVIEIVFDRF
ncbi:MAG: hypothetical protein KF729_16025 [Sandaracinaceae bacterium]|nr:hypothetical protein [Sandaracinaceae bacterium]